MKIHKLIRKYFIDILFLIILLIIFIGGIIAPVNASTDIKNAGNSASTSITELMRSAKINEAIKPGLSPDFTLMSLDGKKVQLNRKQGKVVLLNFWATW